MAKKPFCFSQQMMNEYDADLDSAVAASEEDEFSDADIPEALQHPLRLATFILWQHVKHGAGT